MDLLNSEFLRKVEWAGTFSYSSSRIINVLDIENAEEFILAFSNPEHPVAMAYKKGQDKADFAIDVNLYKQAKEGNLEAMKLYFERRAINEQDNDDEYKVKRILDNNA